MTWTLERLKSNKKPVTLPVEVCLDPEWGERRGKLLEELRQAKFVLDSTEETHEQRRKLDQEIDDAEVVRLDRIRERRDDLQAQLDELDAEFDDKVCRFEFVGLSPDDYEDLVAMHPPTPEQREKASKNRQAVLWNPDTFPHALVAATLVSPKLTEDEVHELWESDTWQMADLVELFDTAMTSCITRATPEGLKRTQMK